MQERTQRNSIVLNGESGGNRCFLGNVEAKLRSDYFCTPLRTFASIALNALAFDFLSFYFAPFASSALGCQFLGSRDSSGTVSQSNSSTGGLSLAILRALPMKPIAGFSW